MNAANLQLSAEEIRLVMDPGVILTKNSIIQKVIGLFAELSEAYRVVLAEASAASTTPGASAQALLSAAGTSPKISRGENYQGLPYVMLDYPRLFGRENVLAIRTFFWWGHAFSVTLHLKGTYRELYLPVLQQHWGRLTEAGFHVGISGDEWRHEHVPDNYRAMVAADEVDGEGPFLKLSAACGLDRWEEAHEVLSGLFRVLVDVLTNKGSGDRAPGADVGADSPAR